MAAQLPPHLLRNLGQKEYDKRKDAALEIERSIKELRSAGQPDRVRDIVHYVVHELAASPQPNVRKGALHALAGVAIGLREDLPRFLPQLLPPVLSSFCDPDCRVRYYACESLYNIAKVARSHCVLHFNEIFEALFKLSADTDLGVQNGFQLLDRLMKDIVAESEEFDIRSFMPLLRRRIFVTNSYTRQFLIGWIAILDSVPDIDMLEHLPAFFDGLFTMLSDLNKEIRQQAYAVLYDFLQEIKQAPQVHLEPIVVILVQHCGSRDRFSRLTALTWLHSFISLGKAQLLPFSPTVLEAILRSISHPEDEIRDAAASTDVALRALLQTSNEGDFDVRAILATLVHHLRADHVRTRDTALQWISMLLKQCPGALLRHTDELWTALLDTLADESEQVVFLDIEVIARLAAQPGYFATALSKLMSRFAQDRTLLEARAPLILRQLSSVLEPRAVYVELASLIKESDDLPFCTLMVQTLNGILHTSPALGDLRDLLRSTMHCKEGAMLFLDLYEAWCHSPVAVLSLCLLAQAFEHASELIAVFSTLDMSVEFLLQLDRLVQLIESPVFAHMRLQLLEPEKHPYLVKALYGLLMLLPQSGAFHTLQHRLSAVPQLGLLRLNLGLQGSKDKGPGDKRPDPKLVKLLDFAMLHRTFEKVQVRYREYHRMVQEHERLNMYAMTSLEGSAADSGPARTARGDRATTASGAPAGSQYVQGVGDAGQAASLLDPALTRPAGTESERRSLTELAQAGDAVPAGVAEAGTSSDVDGPDGSGGGTAAGGHDARLGQQELTL